MFFSIFTQSKRQTPSIRATFVIMLCVLALGSTTAMAAAIYKSVDKDGNIIFTDRPLDGAENINGKEPAKKTTDDSEDDEDGDDYYNGGNVAFSPQPKNQPKPAQTAAPEPTARLPVTVIEILTPIHNTTLIDPIGKIWVELQSYPTSLKKSGLTAELWMNNTLVNSGKRPMLSLPRPERGTHTLQVKLVDDKGRLHLESATTQLHIKQRVKKK